MKINLKNSIHRIKNGEIYFKDGFISFMNVREGEIETEKISVKGDKNYILSFKFRVAIEVYLKNYRDNYLHRFLKEHPFYWQNGVDEAFLKIIFYDEHGEISSILYPVCATSTFFYYDFVKFKDDMEKGWVDTFIKIKTPKNSKFLNILLKIKSKNELKGGFGIGEIFLIEPEREKERYGRVFLRTLDEEGKLTPSKISIFSFENKNYIIPAFEIFYMYPFPYFFNIYGETEFLLPEGRYLIDLSKGFSYSVERFYFYLPSGSEKFIEAKFKRKVKNKWVSSDHHVHLYGHFNTSYPFINEEIFKRICEAEGLDFVMWGMNYVKWKGERIVNDKIIIEKGIELVSHRYGHFCLVGLNKKIKNFPDPFLEYPPLWKYLKDLSKSRTGIISAHPVHTIKVGEDIVKEDEDVVNYISDINRWNLNKILPILSLMDIPFGFDVIIGDGCGTFYTFLREYFRLLNSGFKVFACGSTDSNVDTKDSFNPVGSARTYLYVEGKKFEDIVNSYIKGHTFATNGPLIFPEIENFKVGDEIFLEKEKELEVKFYVYSSFGLSFVDCYYNGEIVKKFDFRTQREGEGKFKINIDKSGWINFIVRGPSNKWVNSWMLPENERDIFGQICITTPFYIKLKEKPFKVPSENLKYYLKWIENLKILVGKFKIEEKKKEEILEELEKFLKNLKKEASWGDGDILKF